MNDFLFGTVKTAGGQPSILPDNSRAALKKACKLPVGMTLQEGDRVLLLRCSGSFVVVNAYRQEAGSN